MPRLRRILAAFTVRFGVRFDVLEPQPAASMAIAARMVRYGVLNPVRAGLVDDPFAWPWSTLRDLVGACFPIWTPLHGVAQALGLRPGTAIRRLCTTADLAPRLPHRGGAVQVAALPAIRQAVAAALRLPAWDGPPVATERRLIVQASFTIGTPRPIDLASALRCSTRTIHRDRPPEHPALDAVLLTLGDPRLRIGPAELSRIQTAPRGQGL